MSEKHFATNAIHEGYTGKDHLGSLSTPIFQTSTYEFDSAEHGEACFAGESDGYMYSRLGNPTVRVLEERVAKLENGERGLAFGSGMGAISAVLVALTKANDHIVSSNGLYGCTYGLLKMFEEKYNITSTFSDLSSEEIIRETIQDNTTVIYLETPINPTMQLIDLELVAKIAKEYDIPVVVDNTFSTPYIQRPIDFGCDIVVHSATKYLNGHGDVIAGIAVGSKEFLDDVAMTTQKDMGAILAPFDAWLILRGLKTLPIRMDRHTSNAEKIVAKLEAHDKVTDIYYPGKGTAEQNMIKDKQMSMNGGMIAFEVDGSKETTQQLLNHLAIIKVAVSLGDAETLVEQPATMTHAVIPEEERLKMGITNSLIRLSVGLEHWEDIWDDLNQALNKLP